VLRYREHRPGPDLRPHIECLWTVWDSVARADRTPERVLPDGCPELIVHLGDPFARLIGRRWVVQPRAFLAGTLTQPWMLRARSRVKTVGVRFRPGATTAVFPLSMSEARDRELRLAGLVGASSAAALIEPLRRARTDAGRFAAIEEWLTARLSVMAPRRSTARAAVALILKAHGRKRIDDVARALGWSRRRIERVFARDLGIRPKLFARIVRLNAVLATLDEPERTSAVDLALETGYFDQAHLLRDFRVLAGRAPRSRREIDGELARHFTRPERLRALLFPVD